MSTDTFGLKLARVIRSWGAEARLGLGSHPRNDTLLDYHDGTLKDRKAEKLREHLALCPECSQRGLDLAFFALPDVDRNDDGFELASEREWTTTHQALELTEPAEDLNKPRRSWSRIRVPSGGFLWQQKFGYVAAALLFVLSFGLAHELIEVRTSVGEFRTDIQLVDLQPIGAGITRDAGLAGAIPILEVDAPLVLILSLLDPGSYADYRVDVLNSKPPDQGHAWRVDNLKLSSEGYLTLLVPPGLMAASEYHVRFYGVNQGRSDLLAEYVLKFRAS